MAIPEAPKPNPDRDLCVHIFYVSSGMVGVCLTVIGLVQVIVTIKKVETIADDLLAIDALLFLSAALIAYWVVRLRGVRDIRGLERVADVLFVIAIALMVAICCFMTYAMSGL